MIEAAQQGPLRLLRLQQLFDSQLPIGAFAHSGGLETYAALPDFDAGGLREVLQTQIELGWGRLDLAACCLAWRQGSAPDALDRLSLEVDAWKTIPGQRLASVRIGRRLLVLARRLFPELAGLAPSPPHQAVVMGAVARLLELPEKETVLFYGHSSLTAALAAATRSMALSPEQAQELLVALQPAVVEAAERALAAPESSLFAATPALDIRAHQQAHLHTRLFQS